MEAERPPVGTLARSTDSLSEALAPVYCGINGMVEITRLPQERKKGGRKEPSPKSCLLSSRKAVRHIHAQTHTQRDREKK